MAQIQQQRPEEPQKTWFERNGGIVIGVGM